MPSHAQVRVERRRRRRKLLRRIREDRRPTHGRWYGERLFPGWGAPDPWHSPTAIATIAACGPPIVRRRAVVTDGRAHCRAWDEQDSVDEAHSWRHFVPEA